MYTPYAPPAAPNPRKYRIRSPNGTTYDVPFDRAATFSSAAGNASAGIPCVINNPRPKTSAARSMSPRILTAPRRRCRHRHYPVMQQMPDLMSHRRRQFIISQVVNQSPRHIN